MLAALLTTAALATFASADDRAVTGVVRDATGGRIGGAAVRVTCGPTAQRVTTDARGTFAIASLPAAPCMLDVSHDGFTPASLLADLTASAQAAIDVVLLLKPFAMDVQVRTSTPGLEESSFAVPQGASVMTSRAMASRPFHLLTQAFREEPGVHAQSTTSAQGSPIIRGLTGQRNVYLLDGVRFNTAAWRDGPSQYLSWIAPAMVDRLEIVRGPGSVQYGSDALGAAINALNAPPVFAAGPLTVNGEVSGTAASAANTTGLDASVTVSAARFVVRAGGWRMNARDLRAGGGQDSHAAVTRFLGLPSTSLGSRLARTGFNQASSFVNGAARLGSATVHTSYLHTGQTDATRYDRMAGGAGLYRSEFVPQTLDFGLVRVTGRMAPFDEASATFSVNRQSDGRLEQSRPGSGIDEQVTRTTAIGYRAQGTRSIAAHHQLVAGAEIYDEYIGGARRITDPAGAVRRDRPEIPDGTRYLSTGVFAQSISEIAPNRLTARGGLRVGHFVFRTRGDQALGVAQERITSGAVTFNTGLVLRVVNGVNAVGSVATGFRAANAFDLGGIGLSGGGGFEVSPERAAHLGALRGSTDGATAISTGSPVAPLDAERVTTYEAGIKLQLARFAGSIIAFDLELRDTIDRRTLIVDHDVLGMVIAGHDIIRQDTAGRVYVAADPRPLVTRVNISRNRVRGFEASGTVSIVDSLQVRAHLSTADGRDRDTGAFMRRMPPLSGGAAVRWQPRSWWVEGTATLAAQQARLSDGDLGDARIGASRSRANIAAYFNGSAMDLGLVRDGVLLATGERLSQVQARVLGAAPAAPLYTATPGFAVFGARVGFPVTRRLDLTLIGENLLDTNYRLHGSGIDEPGFNIQLKTRLRF